MTSAGSIFFSRFRIYFLNAALFSVFINLALLAPSIYMLQIFDRILSSRSNETLFMLTLLAVFALGTMLVLDYLRTLLLAHAATTLDRWLGEKVIASLIEKGSQIGRSDEIHGLRDVAVLRGFLGGSGVVALFDLPWMLFYVLLIYFFHPLLGLIATLGGAALFVAAWANEQLNRKKLESIQIESRRASHYIDQGIANVDVINAMGMAGNIVGQWKAMNERVLEGTLSSTERMGGVSSISRFLRQLIQVLMMCAGAYLVIDQHMTPGIMIASTIILGRALAPIESLIANWNAFVQARLAYARLSPLFADAPTDSVTQLPPPSGQLSVENLALAGKSAERPILRHVAFRLEAGESLAIIGPSASGKSCLARLLVGIWAPSAGHVRLDGADVARVARAQIGPHIGYLPQDVELFPGTVAENIGRMGEPDSELVMAAAQLANVHEMVLRLPDGYDTRIGPGAHILSGGQMQRIALARALYGSPKLVVLDEPNSNLDSEGEALLAATIKALAQRAVTVVVVTHKMSLLNHLDKLTVIKDGRMELFGGRDEILEMLKQQAKKPFPKAVAEQ